jgi:predicted nucleotidyltransferase
MGVKFSEIYSFDEESGILSYLSKKIMKSIALNSNVEKIYFFGSYAKERQLKQVI